MTDTQSGLEPAREAVNMRSSILGDAEKMSRGNIKATLLPPNGPDGKARVEDVVFDDIDDGIKDDYERIFDEVLSEFGATDETQTLEIRVFKVMPTDKVGPGRAGKVSVPWIFSVDHSDANTVRSRCRDEYGSGRYRIQVYVNNKPKRQFDFEVLAAPRPAIPITNANGETSQLGSVVDRLLTRMDQTDARLAEALQRPTPTVDPMDMFTKMATAMGALVGIRQPQGPDALQMLESVTKVAGLLVDARGGGGAAETNIYDVVKEIGPALAQALPMAMRALPAPTTPANAQPMRPMNGRPMQRQMQRPMPQPPMQEQHEPNAPPEVQQPNASAFQVGNETEQVLTMLIRQASRHSADDGSPEFYADYCLDNLPPPMIDYITNTPNVLDQLQQAFPMIAQYRQWFDALVDAVRNPPQDDEFEQGEPLAPGETRLPLADAGSSGGNKPFGTDGGSPQDHAPHGPGVAT